ncbi:MAG TPA: adenylate/guanylate cyclase domain-containing protein [Gaiellaceae bacterium]
MPTCAKCGQDNPEVAKFCLACGSPLEAAAPSAPAEERKLITAVFCDLVGSTARSESLDIEDVKELVSPYHARVRGELERHGGTFEKFSGDAILALFGAPLAHEDDPERAIRAGLAVRGALAQLNAEDEWLDLHFRIGINTGEALVMLDARPSEGEWSAAGDVMNTAARIESAAPVDGILVGEQTYRATRELFEFREAEPIQAKGKAQPVPVWEVVSEREAPDWLEHRLPLVGREQELGELLRFCRQQVAEGRPGLAGVLGAPGIGKSRLLGELVQQLGEECELLVGRCLSYGEGITYWPVEEMVKSAAGITFGDDEATSSNKLGVLLQALETDDLDELRTIAAAIANLIGVETTPEGTYSAQAITQAELHWGIHRLFELLAARRATIFYFEDLHWAEATLLELLGFLVDGSAAAPILVLASARPELKEAAPLLLSDRRHLYIELDALGEGASAALAEEVAKASGLTGAALDKVLRQAGGNPLFIEETVRMLAEGKGAAEGEPAVPDSLQALIASRLDQLEPPVKRVAHSASVVGLSFWPSAVAYLVGGDAGPDPSGGLASLERRDLIHRNRTSMIAGELEYLFKHVLIRDVAYSQLPKRRRSALHARFAAWVAELPGGEDELIEFVAYHLEQSCLLARTIARPEVPPPLEAAVLALARAAAKSERREGFREAERFYSRALALADDVEPGTRAELRYRRARMLVGRGALGPARSELSEVLEAASAVGRLELRCAALVTLANIEWKQGRAGEQRECLVEAEQIAQQIGDHRLGIVTAFELANLRGWFEGQAAEAIEDLRRALARAEEFGDRALLTEAHLRLGTALINLGQLAEAEQRFGSALELAGEDGSHRDEARASTLLGFVKYYRGELGVAEELAAQALEWLERTGDTDLQIQNFRSLARYALARGEFELAEKRLRDVLPLVLELGGWLATDIYRYLAEALVRQGRIEDASELVSFAARSVPEEDHYARASLLMAEAIVATEASEPTAAATAFAEALRLMEGQELQLDLGEARMELARSLRSFGDVGGARTELERARASFSRMDARTVVAQIDRELEELAQGAADRGPLA